MKTSSKQLSHKQQSGFTLIEMIVTVTIAAILASIAIPSFTKMIERNRISTGTNEFLSALILARSEAVKRSRNVIVCSSSDLSTCSGATEFSAGWIIYPDCDNDQVLDTAKTCDMNGDGDVADAVDMSETDAIIKVHGELSGLSIVATTANTDKVRYLPSGRANTQLRFQIGKDASTPSKQIDMGLTGRVRSCKLNSGGC